MCVKLSSGVCRVRRECGWSRAEEATSAGGSGGRRKVISNRVGHGLALAHIEN
jgi:hypothetical protein